MKLLLDTNVLLDCLQAREPFFEDWKRLRVMNWYGDAELWASAQSIADAFYVLRRQSSSEAIQEALLNCMSFLRICSVDERDVKDALSEQWDDLEDCLIHKCAERVKADYLVTRDKKGFEKARIPHLDPADFLALIKREHGISYEDLTF